MEHHEVPGLLNNSTSVSSTFSLKAFVNICNLHNRSLNQPGIMVIISPEVLRG